MACSEPGAIVRGTGDRPSGRVSKRVGVCVFFKEKSTVRPSRPWRGRGGVRPMFVCVVREGAGPPLALCSALGSSSWLLDVPTAAAAGGR